MLRSYAKQMKGIVRRQFDWRLNRYAANNHSENGEDGILRELLRRLRIHSGWVVEFGAWDGISYSNTYTLLEKGNQWQGVYIEGSESRFTDLLKTVVRTGGRILPVCTFVEAEGPNSLDAILSKTPVPIDFPLLSIDVDSIDYFIWEGLKKYRPKIVVIEINSAIPPGVSYVHGMGSQSGSSFASMLDLGHRKGYTLVCHTGNMIFVRDDLLPQLKLRRSQIEPAEKLFTRNWLPRSRMPILGQAGQIWAGVNQRDYIDVSLDQIPTDLESYFPQVIRRRPFSWRVPHIGRIDSRFPGVGLLTMDEATILYATARQAPDAPFLEIGSWIGWSTVALALSGAPVTAVDPVFAGEPQGEACRDSAQRAGVLNRMELIGGYSPAALQPLIEAGRTWCRILIDGNHDGDAPLKDAQASVQLAADDCIILFHDLVLPNIAGALRWLETQGWNTGIYCTAQMMGVAWRGNAEPVRHHPDPRVNWDRLIQDRLPHLLEFQRR